MADAEQRQQAINVILDFFYAVDTNDRPLLESLLHPEVSLTNLNAGKVVKDGFPAIHGAKAMSDYVMGEIGAMDTAHCVNNIRASPLEDGSGHRVRCYNVGYHYRPGAGLLPNKKGWISGLDLTVDIINDTDGRMKIREYKTRILFIEGDVFTMTRTEDAFVTGK